MKIVDGDIVVQTERVFENLRAVLEAAGSGFQKVLKMTVFLKDMADFPKMNEVYAKYFGEAPPARSTVQAAKLPRDVQVEIDCIAVVD
jgi:2-iminobutanoate/2-iminopropanoate deaminase